MPTHQTKVSLVGKRGDESGSGLPLPHRCGPSEDWSLDFCGAFEPVEKEGRLYGRGACDMKGSLATALVAAKLVAQQAIESLYYFVVTSDEEVGMQGARLVRAQSKFFEEMVHQKRLVCREPTLLEVVHAHKGGVRFHVTAKGVSAHTSTPRVETRTTN